jgi:hypothetical protein
LGAAVIQQLSEKVKNEYLSKLDTFVISGGSVLEKVKNEYLSKLDTFVILGGSGVMEVANTEVRRLSEAEKKEVIDTCVLYLYSDYIFLEECPKKPVVIVYDIWVLFVYLSFFFLPIRDTLTAPAGVLPGENS